MPSSDPDSTPLRAAPLPEPSRAPARPAGAHQPFGDPGVLVDDETLVRASQAGDQDAFGELVRRLERPLFNVALRVLRDPEEARDATQTAFVKAWMHLDRFDQRHRFFSWMYRILLNEALN